MDDLNTSSYSQEDIRTLPEYAQSVLPELNDKDLPTLTLISHAHSPPLNPVPNLKIDVRNLPNPPKHIRDAYNGTSKRLQEWMKDDPIFIARRDAIKTEIEAAMTKKMDQHEKEGLKLNLRDDEKEAGDLSSDVKQYLKTDELNDASDEEEEQEEDGLDQSDGADEGNDDGMILRVGIFCAMGRHRSVAMVEELARLPWPGWQVRVEHRDLSKKRGEGKRAGGRDKKSRGTRGGASSYFDEDHEQT